MNPPTRNAERTVKLNRRELRARASVERGVEKRSKPYAEFERIAVADAPQFFLRG